MENKNLTQQINELKKAEVLAHTRYPKLGSWYPTLMGLWAAAYTGVTYLNDPIEAILMIVLVIPVGVFTAFYVKKRGVTPKIKKTPRNIKREMVYFFVALAVLVAMLFGLYQIAAWWIVCLVTFITVAAGTAIYEKRYAAAAVKDESELEAELV